MIEPKKKIPQEEFEKAIQEFTRTEDQGTFYDMFIGLAEGGFETEASLLVLTTWNFGRFRYAVKTLKINHFKTTIKKLYPLFEKIENERFKNIDFDRYAKEITAIYSALSKIEVVKYTGASKIMHILSPHVFIMWDEYIRGEKPKKYYKDLAIVKKGYWHHRDYKYDGSAKSYFKFLKDMQELFRHIKFQSNTRTFAKAIDEHNYVNITMPIQKLINR